MCVLYICTCIIYLLLGIFICSKRKLKKAYNRKNLSIAYSQEVSTKSFLNPTDAFVITRKNSDIIIWKNGDIITETQSKPDIEAAFRSLLKMEYEEAESAISAIITINFITDTYEMRLRN